MTAATGRAVAADLSPNSYATAGDKRMVVLVSNKLVIAGIGTVALAMVGVMLLIGDVLYGAPAAIVAAAASAVFFGFLWMGLPLRERQEPWRGRRGSD